MCRADTFSEGCRLRLALSACFTKNVTPIKVDSPDTEFPQCVGQGIHHGSCHSQ